MAKRLARLTALDSIVDTMIHEGRVATGGRNGGHRVFTIPGGRRIVSTDALVSYLVGAHPEFRSANPSTLSSRVRSHLRGRLGHLFYRTKSLNREIKKMTQTPTKMTTNTTGE